MMRLLQRRARLLAAVFLMLSVLLVLPLPGGAQLDTDTLEDEVNGLILRRTLTRTGNEFFNEFSARMAEGGGIQGFNIVVYEKLLPQTGSFLWITVNDAVVYRSLLQRNRDPMEAVNAAVKAVNDFIYRSYMENGGQLEPSEPAPADIY